MSCGGDSEHPPALADQVHLVPGSHVGMLAIGLDSRHDFRRRNRLNCVVEACSKPGAEERDGARAACTVDMRVVQTIGACPKYIQVGQAGYDA